jgi:hypothetical protein
MPSMPVETWKPKAAQRARREPRNGHPRSRVIPSAATVSLPCSLVSGRGSDYIMGNMYDTAPGNKPRTPKMPVPQWFPRPRDPAVLGLLTVGGRHVRGGRQPRFRVQERAGLFGVHGGGLLHRSTQRMQTLVQSARRFHLTVPEIRNCSVAW